MDIVGEFRRWQSRHPNFITPRLLRVKPVGEYIIELSKGEGIRHEPLYGVTLLERKDYEKFDNIGWKADASKPFYNLKEADRYFKSLVDAVKSCKMYSDDEFIECLTKKI